MMTAGAPIASSRARWLYGLAVFLLLLGQWRPLALLAAIPEPWILVLSEAASGRWGFGTEVVFTHGPFSDLYTRLFNPATYRTVLVVSYASLAFQTIAFTLLAARSRGRLFPLLLLPALFFLVPRDIQLLVTPLLVVLLTLGSRDERWLLPLTVAGALLAAMGTLAKFSLFPTSLGLFLLADIDRLRRRRIPVALATYAIVLAAAFPLLASPGSAFVTFLATSWMTSAGHGAAQAITGPWLDVVVYALLFAAAAAAVIGAEWRRAKAERRFGWDAAAPLLALLFFLWITIKMGFGRHDLHVLTTISGLAVGLCVFGMARLPPALLRRWQVAALAAVVPSAAFYVHVCVALDPGVKLPLTTTLGWSVTATAHELADTAQAIVSPSRWYGERQARRDDALAALARTSPVQALDGSVDAIPSLQSSLIAAGLDYRPRPTIQEYTSYSPSMIALNRRFFSGPRAPDYLIFDTTTIDNRPPFMTEGPLWPLFLARYAPWRKTDGSAVVLRRRATPLGELLQPAGDGIGHLDRPLPIELGKEPLFVAIDLRPTWLGRFAELALKPPQLRLAVTLHNGEERLYRLIPGIAEVGFIVSPLIATAQDFVTLAEGGNALPPISALRVVAGFGGKLAYRSAFRYEVRRIDRAQLAAARDWTLSPAPVSTSPQQKLFDAILDSAGRVENLFMRLPEGLYAHPPRRFSLDVAGMSRLRLAVGMLPGSWTGGSDGVCFRVRDAADENKVLWERCLDPRNNAEDRSLRRDVAILPQGTTRVLLETDCRIECGWDWAYWAEIEPLRQ